VTASDVMSPNNDNLNLKRYVAVFQRSSGYRVYLLDGNSNF
jgi:hypothetical protein